MINDYLIPEPFKFNPLKHHLLFIKEFAVERMSGEKNPDTRLLVKEIKRIGSSVMDIYTGSLPADGICREINECLRENSLDDFNSFSLWTGISYSDFKTVTLSDTSCWTLKFHNDQKRFAHIFPARMSPFSFRVKANTMKSALLYYILIGKDFISAGDLNHARALLGLPPVKDTDESEAITEMIEILRLNP